MEHSSDQIESILTSALEIDSDADRRQFIEQACAGDPELQRRVEELIENHFRAGSFLETPAVTSTTTGAEQPGTVIGPYKLVEQIGQGGFGVVFMAEQHRPVRRKVALKVLKPGMDTGQVVARFEAERQALALMDHPNIAHVLDGGETATGRPYFVMELVKGVPITKYCDDHQLPPRERLALFVPVCEAVQHAHQKGIIHRDIKPSNVLVAVYDGRPVPKVIDFGVAKAMGQQLTERTFVTNFGGIVGTLEYMSPEQAEFNALDIDTRVDIYGLGVLLYELLTGTTPLTKRRVKEAAITEVLRLIREDEPPTPSTRLGESTDSLASISAQRKLEPGRLTKEVRGELDWIVMKCLEKERTRRYATANGLARDIQRFLNDEAVEACPPSASYKLRKFAHKHRKLILATSAFALLLLTATIVSTWQAVRATHAENAERAAKDAETKRRKQAREALDAMYSHVIEEWLAKQTLLLPVHKRFLEQTLRHYEEFATDSGEDEESRAGVAWAFSRVGFIYNRLGMRKDAVIAMEKSRDLFRAMLADFPGVETYRRGLGRIHYNLGSVYRVTGRTSDTETTLREARAIFKDLATDFPKVAEYQQWLAVSLDSLGTLFKDLGKNQEAEDVYNQSLAIHRQLVADHPTVADYRDWLAQLEISRGVLFDGSGRSQEAAEAFDRAVVIYTQLAAEVPTEGRYRHQLCTSRSNLANQFLAARRYPEAESALRETLAINKQLVAEFPAVPKYRRGLAVTLNSLGVVFKNTDRMLEAEEAYGEALAIQRRLAADHPADPDHQNEVAGAISNLGRILLGRKDLDGARSLLEEAATYHQAALKASPRHPNYRRSYRTNRWLFSEALLALKDHAAAAGMIAQFLEAAVEPPRDAYTAACLFAACVRLAAADEGLPESKRQELTTTYGDSALAALRLAIERRAKEVAQIKTDKNLDPLRSRQDFKRLLENNPAHSEPEDGCSSEPEA